MELLDRKLVYIIQLVITGLVIAICTVQIFRDGSNIAAWTLLSGIIGYWFPNPKI